VCHLDLGIAEPDGRGFGKQGGPSV
jgi:hypothetical protein